MSRFNIVLVHPEIPGNTGSIGRTCVALDLRLILIHPCGFDLDEKAVRRAGLDYWHHVDLTEYSSWEEFLQKEAPTNEQMFLFSKNAEETFYRGNYQKNCYLIFGGETSGLPENILSEFQDRTYKLPIYSEHVRSLNLSNAATAAAYEALRHIDV